jgi:hypothetical protein
MIIAKQGKSAASDADKVKLTRMTIKSYRV